MKLYTIFSKARLGKHNLQTLAKRSFGGLFPKCVIIPRDLSISIKCYVSVTWPRLQSYYQYHSNSLNTSNNKAKLYLYT